MASTASNDTGTRREINPLDLAGLQSIAPLSGSQSANVIASARMKFGIPDAPARGTDMAALLRPADPKPATPGLS